MRKRTALRQQAKPKHIATYNKIQARYDTSFNVYVIQPLKELEAIKNEKRSHTDQTAYENAYKIVKRGTIDLALPLG
jgi:tellurite resistance protein